MALRTLIRGMGPWGVRLVLIGGMAPRYLIKEPPAHIGLHPGTTDLDVVIKIAVTPEEECYRTLVTNLKDCGFKPAREGKSTSSFRWERDVNGITVQLEFLCQVTEDGRPGSIRKPLGAKIGSKLGAIQIAGAELVDHDHVLVDIHGELLDGRGRCDDPIMLHVAGVASLLTLKGLAMRDRTKDKDPFDIVWLISAFPGGPAAAATHVRASPIAGEVDLFEAVGWMRNKFASVENEGPAAYARFVSGMSSPHPEAESGENMRLRRDAHGAVKIFLSEWDRLVG
jgi:hypothetical protein